MEGFNSSRTIYLSPDIDLYLVKVSKTSSVLAKRNLTLSTKGRVEEEDAMFLVALVLNFLPTLGAMSKGLEEKKTQTKTNGKLHQIELEQKDNMKFLKNYMTHDTSTTMMHDLML